MRLLATFSSPGWDSTTTRFQNEAKATGAFSKITCLGPDDLENWPPPGRKTTEKGYGYYTWKPVAALKAIQLSQADISDTTQDIFVWADAGCTFLNSQKDLQKLEEYFQKTIDHPSGLLGFIMPYNRYQQKNWTKADIFTELDAHSLKDLFQIWAGCFFMRLTPKNIEILETWSQLCNKLHLVDDSESEMQNYPGFKENRWDQSILSILMYQNDALVINDESKTIISLLSLGYAGGPILDTRIRGSSVGPIPKVPISYSGLKIVISLVYFIFLIILLFYIKRSLGSTLSAS